MHRIALFIFLIFASCTPVRKATYKIEEAHHALYKQKALLVYEVKHHAVHLTNPTKTRCYILKGKPYAKKWEIGDTLVIDSNLTDFYHLKYARKCNP